MDCSRCRRTAGFVSSLNHSLVLSVDVKFLLSVLRSESLSAKVGELKCFIVLFRFVFYQLALIVRSDLHYVFIASVT